MSSMAESLPDLMAESLSFSNHSPKISQISKDLLSRILLRLPLKSLGQSRCVCKPWNSLISSPEFIDQHLSSTRFESDSLLILSKRNRFPVDEDPLYHLYSPPFDPKNSRRTLKTLPNRAKHGSFPIGVVHGVVCIFRVVARPPERNVIFWNPITHKHVSISIPQRAMIEGFGYDPVSKQLKVVAARANQNHNSTQSQAGFEVAVASHRERRWRNLGGLGGSSSSQFGLGKDDMVFEIPTYWLRYDEGNNGSDMFEHYYYEGFIHWLRYAEDDGWSLTTFDCGKEEFQTVALPDELVKCKAPREFIWGPRGEESPEFDKLVAGRCGALFSVQHMEIDSYICNMHIWVMCEYGESESWTKLYTVPELGGFGNVKIAWEDDEIVLWFMGVNEFAASDVTGGVLKRVIRHPNLVLDAYAFKESLLLMDG